MAISAARLIAVLLSLLVHGGLAYAMLPVFEREHTEALDFGSGDDSVVVEQGVAIEGLAKLGDAMETIETAEIVPAETAPPPPEEVKPVEELTNVVTSEASDVEAATVKTEEPEELKEKPPEVVQAVQQPEQVAIVTEQSSGEERSGGDAKAFGIYLSKINQRVQRAKINPRARVSGTVVMRFTVGIDGMLLSKEIATSSGSKILDDAAVAALDRAAPFPPIPPEISIRPLAFTQPFKFILR